MQLLGGNAGCVLFNELVLHDLISSQASGGGMQLVAVVSCEFHLAASWRKSLSQTLSVFLVDLGSVLEFHRCLSFRSLGV